MGEPTQTGRGRPAHTHMRANTHTHTHTLTFVVSCKSTARLYWDTVAVSVSLEC